MVLEGFLINVPKIPGIGLHFFGGVSQQMNQLVTVQRSKNNVRQRSVTVNLLKYAVFHSKFDFSLNILTLMTLFNVKIFVLQLW